jgi:hypothetical protein
LHVVAFVRGHRRVLHGDATARASRLTGRLRRCPNRMKFARAT